MLKEVFTLLTERQILVLKAIVEEFIQTAQPVGSRILSKKEELNFSAATIRNDMADLEDLGFIVTECLDGEELSREFFGLYNALYPNKRLNCRKSVKCLSPVKKFRASVG